MTTAAVDSTTKRTARRLELSEVARRLAFLAPLVALVVLQRVAFPAPLGVVVNGALFGSRIALYRWGSRSSTGPTGSSTSPRATSGRCRPPSP